MSRPDNKGVVSRVVGTLVEVIGVPGVAMFDVVEVGEARIPGEVIGLSEDGASLQLYEYAGGLRPGDQARPRGEPLVAELGPELLGGVFDGLLRDLGRAEDFLLGGGARAGLAHERRWPYRPTVTEGDIISPGSALGLIDSLEATGGVPLKVLCPPDVGGEATWVAPRGDYTSDEAIATVAGTTVSMSHRWPVRVPRPTARRMPATAPLETGQRVLDLLFPIAKGSTAAVPGGFGTGKTMLLQQIAKWCNADVPVYVGCGERGNEMADVAAELATIENPRTGGSLLERVVLIANTSNMPVMAREASIYMGATVAEYFRDMGLDSIVIADSTSRWAEAMREVSARSGALPAEEGYPAGLASSLAAFYERAGQFTTLDGTPGSLSIIGAVSPSGGDMTEPVTAHTRRFVRAVWTLDRDLAYARHYPAVTWRESFARDVDSLTTWHQQSGDDAWSGRRDRVLDLLSEADRLESIVELVGTSALPDRERLVLLIARLLREGVLQQNALVANDATSSPGKGAGLLDLVLGLFDAGLDLVERRHMPVGLIEEIDLSDAFRAREMVPPDGGALLDGLRERLISQVRSLQ